MRLLVALLVLTLVAFAQAEEATPVLLRGHAHNDYHHKRPLLDALDHGFNSAEADVFLIGDQLLVAHWYHELNPHRTLESLYLDPLRKRIQEQGGQVHPGAPPFRLLVQLCGDSEPVYAALAPLLVKYADILTEVRDGRITTRAVTIVLTGGPPRKTIAAQSLRYVAIDGRLHDLGTKTPTNLMPLVSADWKSHFQWKGSGEIPAAEKEKLEQYVRQANQDGRQLRFWGTPHTRAMWKVLDECGVDVINTDDLSGLEKFLRNESRRPQ